MRIWCVIANGSRGRAWLRRAEQPGYDAVAEWDAPEARMRDAELGEDRPGRVFASAGAGARSAIEADGTDDSPKEHARRDHIAKVAQDLAAALQQGVTGLVLVAPERLLPELRAALPTAARARVLAEAVGDWTRLPTAEVFTRLDALYRAAAARHP